MKSEPFHFKKFYIYDDKSSMKVGTDAIMLGIFSNTVNAKRILDIGTGCGIISLMLAQKSNAKITAIDIDDESIKQATLNFNNSPWKNSLSAKSISLQDYLKTNNDTFDLIVSNPPFFSHSLKPEIRKRLLARHDENLNFNDLCHGVNKLLNENGKFYTILPSNFKDSFIKISGTFDLHLTYCCNIIPVEGKKANRIILGFQKKKYESIAAESIVIRMKNGGYTKDFHDISANYYLFLKDKNERNL